MQPNTQKTKFIIGSGITGLVWKHFHPEFQIISPDVGGMFTKTHMVWLHRTAETEMLLKNLGLPLKPKRSYIGYYNDGWISDTQSDYLNERIIQRKMTPWNEPIAKIEIKTRDLSLSKPGENNFMNTWDVDLEEVIRRLSETADVIPGYVKSIDKDFIHVFKTLDSSDGDAKLYDTLVTSVAAPLFWKSYEGSSDLKFKSDPITNIVVDKPPVEYDNSYEMVYYTDPLPFSRISYLNGKYAVEITGIMTKEEFEKMYPRCKVLEYFVVKYGRIWENENTSPQDNIIFSGRFAQWKHKIVTENVIHQASNTTF